MRTFLVIGLCAIVIGILLYFLTPLATASYIVTVIGVVVTIYDVVRGPMKGDSISQRAKAKKNATQVAIGGSNGESTINQKAKGKDVKQIAIGGDLNEHDE